MQIDRPKLKQPIPDKAKKEELKELFKPLGK